MRLFIAINFEEAFVDALTDLQERLMAAGATGNFTKRENLHMTLAFIGDYGSPEDVLDAMESIDFRPLDIRLDGVQHFREMYFARIAENKALEACVRRLRRSLSDKDIPFDKKKFSPHITLIRRVSYIGGDIPAVEPATGEMTVRNISLMRSDRGKNGMIYTEIGNIG